MELSQYTDRGLKAGRASRRKRTARANYHIAWKNAALKTEESYTAKRAAEAAFYEGFRMGYCAR